MRMDVMGSDDRARSAFRGARVHMIGIGGCGMSGAAGLLLELGADVSGSDMAPFDGMDALVLQGACVTIGRDAAALPGRVDLVVASAAIHESHEELIDAHRRGVVVLKYAELLGLLMGEWSGVAVAGTHGKSTTSAMCAYLFREAGLSPSFVIGARSEQLGGNSAVGSGSHLIVEACEYDRSFLRLRPDAAAVLNVELDHLDCYHDLDEIISAFGTFCAQVSPGGLVVCNGQDPWAMLAAVSASARVETFGFNEDVDWCATNLVSDLGRYTFDVTRRGQHVMTGRLAVPGLHNVSNALAAIALAYDAGADPESLEVALPGFEGLQRRLTWRGKGRGVTIVDDYAHHPTEIRATIEAARYRYEPNRTWVIFQPHQYSRTRWLMDDFAESFGDADEVIVADIYAAREVRPDGADGAAELATRIQRLGGCVKHVPALDAVADHVAANVAAGDMVLTMGAGDVWKVADALVERIC